MERQVANQTQAVTRFSFEKKEAWTTQQLTKNHSILAAFFWNLLLQYHHSRTDWVNPGPHQRSSPRRWNHSTCYILLHHVASYYSLLFYILLLLIYYLDMIYVWYVLCRWPLAYRLCAACAIRAITALNQCAKIEKTCIDYILMVYDDLWWITTHAAFLANRISMSLCTQYEKEWWNLIKEWHDIGNHNEAQMLLTSVRAYT